ncbi:hypothetical protein [Brucella pituitosa]|uniref:hypothetical protein n=1 Tax=Brucella pituitosa TaxID=571256 RepID=UPI00126025FD|nr:hypothetical protein [Brucella pituitosa]
MSTSPHHGHPYPNVPEFHILANIPTYRSIVVAQKHTLHALRSSAFFNAPFPMPKQWPQSDGTNTTACNRGS